MVGRYDTTSIPLANDHLDHLLNMEGEQVLVEISQQYALFFTFANAIICTHIYRPTDIYDIYIYIIS